MQEKIKEHEIVSLEGTVISFEGRMNIPIKIMRLTQLESESLHQLASDHLDTKYELHQWVDFTVHSLLDNLVYLKP